MSFRFASLARASSSHMLRRAVMPIVAQQPMRSLASESARGTLQIVSSADAPKAIGPYSQGVKANGFVFVSGCLGINPKTGDITGDVVAQTKQAMENMRAVLTAGNSSFAQVVKTTILLADIKDFRQCARQLDGSALAFELGCFIDSSVLTGNGLLCLLLLLRAVQPR